MKPQKQFLALILNILGIISIIWLVLIIIYEFKNK